MGEISVSGTGFCAGIPDMATIYVGVMTERDNPADARRANETVSKSLKRVCKDQFKISGEHIYAPGSNANPRWDIDRKEILGYVANENIVIHVDDLDQIDELIDFIHVGLESDEARAASVSVSNVSFDIKDKDEMFKKARTAAIVDAVEKAELYAQAVGKNVKNTISISENMGYGGVRGGRTAAIQTMSMDGGSAVAGGETQVEVTVSAVFEFN